MIDPTMIDPTARATAPAAVRVLSTAKPWTLTEGQWQAARGVKQPWIAEISSTQYARLSKRGKAAYDARRRAEWQASADCKAEYRAAVVAAFDAGRFRLDNLDVTRDARHAVMRAKIERDQSARMARFAEAQAANRIRRPGDVRPGDRVFVVIAGRYGTVRKVWERSISVEIPGIDRRWSVTPRGLQWLQHDDLKAAAETGAPINPHHDEPTAA